MSSSLSNTYIPSHFSRVRLFATPWTVAFQAPLSMGFSRQEYWSGLLFSPIEYLMYQHIYMELCLLHVNCFIVSSIAMIVPVY